MEDGTRTVLGQDLAVPPVNIGPRSTPDYGDLAADAVHALADGGQVFAGQRDDPFFVDLGSTFDLLGLRPLNDAHAAPLPVTEGIDTIAGYNTQSIALQVPIADLVEDDPVIGVLLHHLPAQDPGVRRQRRRSAHAPWAVGAGVSRLGMPLVNEVVIPLRDKDRFNASEPADDAQFLDYVQNPELGELDPGACTRCSAASPRVLVDRPWWRCSSPASRG